MSYDNSYTQCDDDVNEEDPPICENLSKKTKRKRKISKKDTAKRKRKKKRKKRKKSEALDRKKRSESSLFNKQILRVREGNLGERVVTFSRRKSVIDASIKTTDKTEDGDAYKALLDAQKALDEERKQLKEERLRMEGLLKEMNDESVKLDEERKEFKEKQAKLLRDELDIAEQKHALKQKK
eukprot:278875_1